MRSLLAIIPILACGVPQEADSGRFVRVERPVDGTPGAVAVRDATGDGRADVLVASDDGLVIFEGDGAGGLTRLAPVPAGAHPVDIAAADLDGDGRADLAIANHDTDYLTLLRATAAGRYEVPRWSPLHIAVSPHPHAVAAGDLNEDGHADLVFDDRDGERLSILAGDGAGGFAPLGSIAVGGDPYRGMAVADLDGDGHLDVAAPIERAVSVRRGDGRGGFVDGGTFGAGGIRPFAVLPLDWNGDGAADLGVGSGEGETGVAVLLGDGSGGFAPAPGSPWDGGHGPKALAVADIDGDGREDLVVTAWDAPRVTILFGGGAPRVEAYEVGANPFGVAAGDLDGDGRPDLVTADQGSGSITVLLSSGGAPGRR